MTNVYSQQLFCRVARPSSFLRYFCRPYWFTLSSHLVILQEIINPLAPTLLTTFLDYIYITIVQFFVIFVSYPFATHFFLFFFFDRLLHFLILVYDFRPPIDPPPTVICLPYFHFSHFFHFRFCVASENFSKNKYFRVYSGCRVFVRTFLVFFVFRPVERFKSIYCWCY